MRSSTLARKRTEYASLVDVTFSKGRGGLDQQIWHQIEIDVPRTRPGVLLWNYEATQRVSFCLTRSSLRALHALVEHRTHLVRVGYSTSCQRICPGDQ